MSLAGTPTIALPVPGTPAAIAAAVKASTSIKKMPSPTVPQLADLASDTPNNTFLKNLSTSCFNGKVNCVLGPAKAKKTIVLFGDSHAWMWVSAIYPTISKLGYKFILWWNPGCIAATVPLWNSFGAPNAYDTACQNWRSVSIYSNPKP
jgi:hypothetical protein